MKKEILEALKARFPGVSDAVLNRIADKLAKTAKTQEDVTTEVEAVTIQQVIDSYGDSRATEAQQTAVTNYEKKHGLKDGVKAGNGGDGDGKNPKEPEKNTNGDNGDMPAWAKTLIDSNKALELKLASMEGEKTANTRKSVLNGILKDAPEKIRQRYEKDFARMQFNDEDDFKSWIDEVTPDIQALVTEYTAKGGVVTRPKAGTEASKEKEISPLLKQRIEERKAETSTPAIIGLTVPNK